MKSRYERHASRPGGVVLDDNDEPVFIIERDDDEELPWTMRTVEDEKGEITARASTEDYIVQVAQQSYYAGLVASSYAELEAEARADEEHDPLLLDDRGHG